jgi:hypothetical protein
MQTGESSMSNAIAEGDMERLTAAKKDTLLQYYISLSNSNTVVRDLL